MRGAWDPSAVGAQEQDGVGARLLTRSLRPSQEAADAALVALVRRALQARA